MAKWKLLGDLERRVMDHLWCASAPQTVREVRDDRAHRYAAVHGRDELVAGLMVDVLDQVADAKDRTAALVHFVESVGTDDLHVLQRALGEVEKNPTMP